MVLDSCLAGCREDALPVDFALANVGHVAGLSGLACGAAVVAAARSLCGPVLYMHEWESAGAALKILHGILPAPANPPHSHLHRYNLSTAFPDDAILRH